MELKREFELTLQDFIDYNLHFVRKRQLITSAIMYTFLIAIIIYIVLLGDDWTLLVTPTVIITIAALAFFPILTGLLTKYTARKQYNSNNLMKGRIECVLNELGINQTIKHSNTFAEWRDVFKANESKSGFYIYISKYQAFILPKRILTAEEQSVVITLLKKHMQPDKLKLIAS